MVVYQVVLFTRDLELTSEVWWTSQYFLCACESYIVKNVCCISHMSWVRRKTWVSIYLLP
jgi:hypothetical protein